MNDIDQAKKDSIDWVKPIGYLKDSNQLFIFIELSDQTFALVHSPQYEIVEKVPLYTVQAAIEKFGYIPIDNPKTMKTMNEVIEFLNTILHLSKKAA